MSESMRERFVVEMQRLLDDDPSVAIVLADISTDQFAGAARRHPDRVVNVGIREQLLVGTAAGLAHTGLRPVVHSIATFLVSRPYEQIKLDLGHQGLGAVLVSTGASYDYAAGGRTHQAPEDVALLNTLPGWSVHVPGHEDEVAALLYQAVRGGGRAYVRLSTATNRHPRDVQTGRWQVVRTGTGPVVVAVGPLLDPVLEAVGDLDVTVLYAATVRPVDAEALRASVDRGGTVVLAEPYQAGTSTARVADVLADRPHRVVAVGVRDAEMRRYGGPRDHAAAHGLDASGIRASVSALLADRRHDPGRDRAPALR